MVESGSWIENTCRLGATCLRCLVFIGTHPTPKNLLFFKIKRPGKVVSPRGGSGSWGARARASYPKTRLQTPRCSWCSESPGCSAPGCHPPQCWGGPGGHPQLHWGRRDHAGSTTEAPFFILPAPPHPLAGPQSIFQLKINQKNNSNKPVNPKEAGEAPHQRCHDAHPSCRDRDAGNPAQASPPLCCA